MKHLALILVLVMGCSVDSTSDANNSDSSVDGDVTVEVDSNIGAAEDTLGDVDSDVVEEADGDTPYVDWSLCSGNRDCVLVPNNDCCGGFETTLTLDACHHEHVEAHDEDVCNYPIWGCTDDPPVWDFWIVPECLEQECVVQDLHSQEFSGCPWDHDLFEGDDSQCEVIYLGPGEILGVNTNELERVKAIVCPDGCPTPSSLQPLCALNTTSGQGECSWVYD